MSSQRPDGQHGAGAVPADLLGESQDQGSGSPVIHAPGAAAHEKHIEHHEHRPTPEQGHPDSYTPDFQGHTEPSLGEGHVNSSYSHQQAHIPTASQLAATQKASSKFPSLDTSTFSPDGEPSSEGAHTNTYAKPDHNITQPKQNVPSLLTQALAAARGIPTAASTTSSDTGDTRDHTAQAISQPAADANLDRREAAARPSDIFPSSTGNERDGSGQTLSGGNYRPAAEMATATAIATTVPSTLRQSPSVSASLDPSDLKSAREMIVGHSDFLDQGKTLRPVSLDDKTQSVSTSLHEIPTLSASPEESTTPTRQSYLEARAPLLSTKSQDHTGREPRGPPRPKHPEHRFTLGPEKTEKIWSIGSGGDGQSEDGQVEQSVAEAMAGVEPNARSRKASYSLRFFKEGMPQEELPRRKDTKPLPKDKLSPAIEEEVTPESQQRPVSTEKDSKQDVKNPTKPYGVHTSSAATSDQDQTPAAHSKEFVHFNKQVSGDNSLSPSSRSTSQPTDNREWKQLSPLEVSSALSTSPDETKRQGRARGRHEAGESPDDAEGDESGEEKISSAVFVPHQELESDSLDERDTPTSAAPSRPRSLSKGKPHPWLVKADEPEPEIRDEKEDASQIREVPSVQAPEKNLSSHVESVPLPVGKVEDEIEFEIKPLQSVQTFPQVEALVHDHQSQQTQQPLEAIELIPYKHQVGGHTTIWRFSRRAVCKQLNNRENEFYETIERYHRDLLPFLPRYIGVLNVTFQKQARRRSTHKKDDGAPTERKRLRDQASPEKNLDGASEEAPPDASPAPQRVISQSLAHSSLSIPTVTFSDNKHILPRNLLQPTPPPDLRRRSISNTRASHEPTRSRSVLKIEQRPPMDGRPNSWGATTVNKRLRNEVFNDAFLKQPVEVQKHRRPHQRSIPRPTLQRLVRTVPSDPNIGHTAEMGAMESDTQRELIVPLLHGHSHSDMGPDVTELERMQPQPLDSVDTVKDVTGTSAPEPDTFKASPMAIKKKRRYSAGGLRRRPEDVRESRGDLKYFEEADDADYKEYRKRSVGNESAIDPQSLTIQHTKDESDGALVSAPSAPTPELLDPFPEFKKIPRPINPKEAKSQRDRVEYFLLLEDLTAGMKRPCMMDLKMGTRQYGVEANSKKQKSQQAKCAATTSAELGVRICGLQVWNAKKGEYEFQDKYFGRKVKVGCEFQSALQKFLYDGVDSQSILRHIPVVLRKLAQLEQIVREMNGYRFYAASLLMFYDGDTSEDPTTDYETAYDSTTDAATDAEDYRRKKKRNRKEIDFKIADFANSLTPLDKVQDKPCPPSHPEAPDSGFLKGLRSLRKYFLRIQRDVRKELGVDALGRSVCEDERDEESDAGMISL